MPPTSTIPESILALLPEDAKLAIASAQVGPTDAEKTAYCASCRRHTGPQTPLCDRCTMQGLLAAIALLGEAITGTNEPADSQRRVATITEPDTRTAQEFVETWDRGDLVTTVELGGLGPGYEQAIQMLAVELVRDNLGKPLPAPESAEADSWGDDTVRKHDEAAGGFSGAQVGAAKGLAYRILHHGWGATLDSMREHDLDRIITVSKHWPQAAESTQPETPAVPSIDYEAGVTAETPVLDGFEDERHHPDAQQSDGDDLTAPASQQ